MKTHHLRCTHEKCFAWRASRPLYFTLILQSQQSIGHANALIWRCEAEGWGEEWNGIEPNSCVQWFVIWTRPELNVSFFHVLDALTPHGLNLLPGFLWFILLLLLETPDIAVKDVSVSEFKHTLVLMLSKFSFWAASMCNSLFFFLFCFFFLGSAALTVRKHLIAQCQFHFCHYFS